MYGIRGFEQNSDIAREHFEIAAEAGENEAFGPLGNMYLKGIGVNQNNETALKYFKIGSEKGDLTSLNGLGYMYANGFGVEKDLKKAAEFFEKSSNKGNPEGQYNLGLFYMTGQGVPLNYKNAYNLMTAAAAQHQTLANYYLGIMHLKGLGASKDCELAVKFLKTVSDRSPISRIMDDAYELFLEGDFTNSLLKYSEASELGFEVAQINAAHIIDKALIDEEENSIDIFKSSIRFHQMAADQNHVSSLVKLGDFYYYGVGTEVNVEKSLINYKKASDMRNAQAMFNLGYMHERGIGLKTDFHLAKRYYDLAKETNKKAIPPVYLALTGLYIRWGLSLMNKEGLEQIQQLYLNDALEIFTEYENLIFLCLLISFSFFVWLRILISRAPTVHEHQD
jgi:SEL1 protein